MKNHAIWALGFRPFFLLGPLLSILFLFLWMLHHLKGISWLPYDNPVVWHGHEMIFGFACAIIVGFLFTATQNWTGIRGVHGRKLQLIVFVWLLGRLFPFLLKQYPIIIAVTDLIFLPFALFLLFPYLAQKKQRRNYIFFLFFSLLFTSNVLFHLEILQVINGWIHHALLLAVNTILLIIVLIGGRVIPFFFSRVVNTAKIQRYQVIEVLSIVSVFVFLTCTFFGEYKNSTAIIAILSGTIHLFRWLSWKFWHTWKIPILWVLYSGYIWLVVGFFVKGVAILLPQILDTSTHAFTTGAIGVLVYGMISRVSLGHTGRPIQAHSIIVIGYIIINLAAFLRICIPIIMPFFYYQSIIISSLLWIIAYSILLFKYFLILTQPRLDGGIG